MTITMYRHEARGQHGNWYGEEQVAGSYGMTYGEYTFTGTAVALPKTAAKRIQRIDATTADGESMRHAALQAECSKRKADALIMMGWDEETSATYYVADPDSSMERIRTITMWG